MSVLRYLITTKKKIKYLFSKFTDKDLSQPESTRRSLNKIKFRVHIEFTENDLPDWVKSALEQLRKSVI